MSEHYIDKSVTVEECNCIAWSCIDCNNTGKVATRACFDCLGRGGTLYERNGNLPPDSVMCLSCNGTGRVPYEGDGPEIEVTFIMGGYFWSLRGQESGGVTLYATEALAVAAARSALGKGETG